MGLYQKRGSALAPLLLCPRGSLRRASASGEAVERRIGHVSRSTGSSRDAREFRRLPSEVMRRTPAFLLRRKRKRIRGQISSSLIPAFFFIFFIFPGRELRPWLCRDSRHEQGLGRSAGTGGDRVSKNKKSAGTARFAADKKRRRGGRGGCIRAGNPALPFGLLLYHTTIKTQLKSPEWLAFLSAPQLPTVGRIHP